MARHGRRGLSVEAGASRAAEIRDGVRDIAPAAIAGAPIGLLFGAVAAGKGLSVLEVGLMSGLVFAGGAQFAAIEIWSTPVPVAAIALSTLLINMRHVLMSASLARRTGAFARWQKLLGFSVLADENWAFAERRAERLRLTPAYLLGMGAAFWLNWLVWTTLGAWLGSFLGPPERFGADFAFTALFIGLVAGFWRGVSTAITVLVAAVGGALAYRWLGSPWHVPAGALGGIAAAFLAAGRGAGARPA